MTRDTELPAVFAALRRLMQPYARRLDRAADGDTELSLNTRHPGPSGKPIWFGGVRLGKRYVSYHLMPVYVNPKLLEGVSAALRRRMQGKSCFNFTTRDPDLFRELADLTAAGFADYERRGYV